jgi:electron transfer flavoprotein alpha subunit
MSEMLVFCENEEVALELVSQANRIKENLHASVAALILNNATEEIVQQYFNYGADKVYVAKSDLISNTSAGIYADTIAQVMTKQLSDILLIGSTRSGKLIAPMVAQKLGSGCVTDAIGIKLTDGAMQIDRYSYGGSTVATQEIKTAKKVIAVMPKTFQLGEKSTRQGEVIKISLNLEQPKLDVLEKQAKTGESVPIEEAETLVCVGRGLADKKDIAVIKALADAIKGEIGATRPLTHDWQWFHESREVGLSGKKCKPRLCISIGVSGQIQHTVGIRGSKIIVAINKDKNAPIFKMADYGIVADLYDVVPRLTQKILNLSNKH